MIRKLAMLMFIMVVAFALAACGGNKSGSSGSSKGNNPKTTQSGNNSKSGSSSQSGSNSGSQTAPKTKGLVNKDKTVAVVNGKKINGKKYNNVLQQVEASYQQQGQDPTTDKVFKQAKKQALNSVVGTELILQDADKKGYQPSDKKIKQQLSQVEKKYGGKDEFKKLLEKQNMTIDQYKKAMATQLEFDTYLNKEVQVKVTDKEIKAAYQQYKSGTKNPQKLSKIKPAIKQQLKQQKQNPKLSKIVDQLKKEGNVSIKI